MELSDRKRQILKVVVEDYVRTAEPVGSKAIAAEMGGSVSSATIRNELSDLTEMGYLEQPHTSAGRMPSPKGYRLYVNELMEAQRLSLAETEKINQSLQLKMEELDRLLAQAGRAVSSLVRYPAYVSASRKTELTVRRFELLAVDERNCILVMMTSDSKVKSQLLRMQLKVDPADLPAAANLLNSHFTNTDPGGMSRHLMSVADQVSPQLFLLLSQAVGFAADALEEAGRREIVTAGASRLLKLPEFRDADKAHELMSFLADSKEELPQPLHREMEILIGPENVKEVLRDTSVVVASYDIGDDMRGLIGVVGPTRMDYAAVAARLSGFAEGLTRLFGKQEELPGREQAAPGGRDGGESPRVPDGGTRRQGAQGQKEEGKGRNHLHQGTGGADGGGGPPAGNHQGPVYPPGGGVRKLPQAHRQGKGIPLPGRQGGHHPGIPGGVRQFGAGGGGPRRGGRPPQEGPGDDLHPVQGALEETGRLGDRGPGPALRPGAA